MTGAIIGGIDEGLVGLFVSAPIGFVSSSRPG
jgi:hypothetical protein